MLRTTLAVGAILIQVGAGNSSSAWLGVRVENLEGKPVLLRPAPDQRALVLHFWATWCPPCREELQALDRAVRACRNSRTRVVAVSVEDDPKSVREFIRAHGIELEVFRDPRGRAFRQRPDGQLPANLIWEPGGVRDSNGPLGAATWRALLEELGCDDEGDAKRAPTRPDGSTPGGR